ncbi:hypothetical protein BDR22DRAFT_865389 [Usnea florida]
MDCERFIGFLRAFFHTYFLSLFLPVFLCLFLASSTVPYHQSVRFLMHGQGRGAVDGSQVVGVGGKMACFAFFLIILLFSSLAFFFFHISVS